MVFYLLRRDDSWWVAWIGAAIAPLVLLSGASWGCLCAIGFFGLVNLIRFRVAPEPMRFQLGLPIAGHQLLWLRVAAASLVIWLPASVAALVLAVFRGGNSVPEVLCAAAVFTLSAILPLTAYVGIAPLSAWISVSLWLTALAAGAAAWFVLPPMWHLALFITLDAAVLLHALLTVPPALEISPREIDEKTSSGGGTHSRPVWWPIVKAACPWLAIPCFGYGMLFLMGSPGPPTAAMLTFAAGVFCRERIRWLCPLPIPRRVFLWATLAVSVVPMAAGFAVRTWVYAPPFLPASHPRLNSFLMGTNKRDQAIWRTTVPLEFWRCVVGRIAPTVTAPWGEAVQPLSRSIPGLTCYNPYTATRSNSSQFFEWQVGNATQALYGRRLSWEQYTQLLYEKSLPQYPQEKRVEILGFAGLCFLLLAGSYLWNVNRWRNYIALVYALLILPDLGIGIWRFGAPSIVGPLFQAIFMHLAIALPSNPFVLGSIAAFPVLLMYWFVERKFARWEPSGAHN